MGCHEQWKKGTNELQRKPKNTHDIENHANSSAMTHSKAGAQNTAGQGQPSSRSFKKQQMDTTEVKN